MTDYRPVLYLSQLSTRCARVKRAVRELEVDVDQRDILLSRQHRQELKELAGNVKVPCLVIAEETVVQDADEIVKYLQLRYGDRRP
jgi:glutathione S-transferase